MNRIATNISSKVLEVTLVFWIVKVAATTLCETGGYTVTMTMNLGYFVGTAIFVAIFIVAAGAQIVARRFHPFLHRFMIVATTTAGTTMADFADSSTGIGHAGGSSILFVLLTASFGVWYRSAGSLSVNPSRRPGSKCSIG